MREPSNEDELEVELINWNSSGKLGFSIAGGVGSQHIRGDNGIYVKSIMEGSLLSWDGRIWVGDLLVALKQGGLDGERFDLTNCTHEEAVRTLRWVCSGKKVVLVVRKTEINLIGWKKNDHLGFSIAGGIDREHIPGDNRIYITNVVEGSIASRDGRISVGDRLLGIKTSLKTKGSLRPEDFFVMDKCTHSAAVETLQKARKGKQVILILSKEKLPEDYRRLRFDDPPALVKKNGCQESQKSLVLPHPSSKANPSKTVIKSILTKKGSSTSANCNATYLTPLRIQDARLCDFLNMDYKKPVHIKYISQEENESCQKDLKIKSNNVEQYENGPSSGTLTLGSNLPYSNQTSKYCANSNSPINCSYDSALSSMSSGDESRFLDFSGIADNLPLVGFPPTSPTSRHVRQNSKHIIEPQIERVNGPVAHFSRPIRNENVKPNINNQSHSTIASNNKKLNRTLKTTRSSSCTRVPETHKTSNMKRKNSIDESFIIQKDPTTESLNKRYFNKRYNITPGDKEILYNQIPLSNLYTDDFCQNGTVPYFDHINTKHFTKTIAHYVL